MPASSARPAAWPGLLRGRKFRQDAAHPFRPEAAIGGEYERIFDICDRFYAIFGLTYRYRLGTRPEKFIGDVSTWDSAERILTDILEERTGGRYDLEPGDGAFSTDGVDVAERPAPIVAAPTTGASDTKTEPAAWDQAGAA